MKTVLILFLTLSFSSFAFADSLWSGLTVKDSSLFVDEGPEKLKENDIVVILIDEKTTASAKADTDAEVDDKVEGSISNWFSLDNAADLLNILKFDFDNNIKSSRNSTSNLPKWGFKIKNSFEGEGSTNRNNTVVAQIAARVIEVRPNGNLVLEGKRYIHVNNETTILTVTGVVSNEDISADRTVSSRLIADLRLRVDGKGIASNVQKRGLLSHLLNLLR